MWRFLISKKICLGLFLSQTGKRFVVPFFLSEPLPFQFPLLLSSLPQGQLHHTSSFGPNLPVFVRSGSVAPSPPTLSLCSWGELHLFRLCASMAPSSQHSGAKCRGWKQMTHQFFLHPETGSPFGYVLSVHYYFIWLIHISLEPAFVNSVFTASAFQFKPHFLLVDHTFSPFSQALLCLISCPSKTPYLTPAAGLRQPIFPFPSEIRDFLSSLLHTRCFPALPHLPFQLSPAL